MAPPRLLRSDSFRLVLRILLGLVFLWAGLGKIYDSQGASTFLEALGLVTREHSDTVTLGIASIEVTLGAALMGGWDLWLSSAIAFVLLALFTLVSVYAVASGAIVPCGCFAGAPESEIDVMTVARNLGLVVVAGSLAYSVSASTRSDIRVHAVGPAEHLSLNENDRHPGPPRGNT